MDRLIQVETYALAKTEEILNFSVDYFNIHNLLITTVLKSKGSYVKGLINEYTMYLDLRSFTEDADAFFYVEYDSFADDPVIGTVYGTWQDCVAAMICHEIAHIIDITRVIKFIIGDKVERLYDGEFKNLRLGKNLFKNRSHHNSSWKEIYRILRCNFV